MSSESARGLVNQPFRSLYLTWIRSPAGGTGGNNTNDDGALRVTCVLQLCGFVRNPFSKLCLLSALIHLKEKHEKSNRNKGKIGVPLFVWFHKQQFLKTSTFLINCS